jgi:hypothetical protein
MRPFPVLHSSPDDRQVRLRKQPHDLHRCTELAQLHERLAARDVNVMSLVAELVKPTARYGVLIGGSLAERVGTEVSDLDIMVFMIDGTGIKPRRREIQGNPVTYLPSNNERVVLIASFFISGIEVDLQIAVNPAVARVAVPADARHRPELVCDDLQGTEIILSLGSTWVVHGAEVIEMWREHYQVSRRRMARMLEEFVYAGKVLEDMQSGIGLDEGHVGMLGVEIVGRMLRALLMHRGYSGMSSRWMRVLARQIAEADAPTREVLITGRRLLFPGYLSDEHSERAYFEQVREWCRSGRRLLSADPNLREPIDALVRDLDFIL